MDVKNSSCTVTPPESEPSFAQISCVTQGELFPLLLSAVVVPALHEAIEGSSRASTQDTVIIIVILRCHQNACANTPRFWGGEDGEQAITAEYLEKLMEVNVPEDIAATSRTLRHSVSWLYCDSRFPIRNTRENAGCQLGMNFRHV